MYCQGDEPVDVKIISHLAGENLLTNNPGKWHTVAVVNGGHRLFDQIAINSKSYCLLCFDDIDYPMSHYIMPNIEHVREALEFCKGKNPVMFTCHGGTTRSAALAYVCMCQVMSPKEAMRIFTHGRHYPNRCIIKYGAKLLNDDDIYNVYDAWIEKDIVHPK